MRHNTQTVETTSSVDRDAGNLRILLVEDDEVDAMLVRRTLSSESARIAHLVPHFELTHVDNLPEALERLRTDEVDVILLDLNLVEYRGLETFNRVHERVPDIPVVVLTGLADDEIAIETIRRGAQDYLVKEQLDAHLLGRTLRYALERQHLRDAERKAQRYLDIAPVVFLVLDLRGNITLVNHRGCEILGYRENEVIGRNWFQDFIPPRMREPMREVFEGLLNGREEMLEYYENPVLHRSGEERLIAWHNTVMRDRRGRFTGVLSSGEDITQRRRAELMLRESERRLATLLSNLPGMAYRSLNNRKRTMLFASEGGRALTGHPPDRFVEDREFAFAELVHPDDRARVWEAIQEAVEADHPYRIEYRLCTESGEERWVLEYGRAVADGTPKRFLEGIITDISDRKAAEQALRRYTERLQTLQAIDRDILAAESADAIAEVALARVRNLVPNACCASVLTFDGELSEASVLASTMDENRAFDKTRRYPLTEQERIDDLAAGCSVIVEDLVGLESLSPLHRELLAAGVRGYVAVPLIVDRDLIGALTLYRTRPEKVEEEHIAIARELADSVAIAIRQTQLFEQIQRHSEELERRVAERTEELRETNAELEAFAYSVSHDLRNPLGNIIGFAEALVDIYGEQLGAEGKEYLEAVLESAQGMDRLIEELLAYSRMARADIRLEPVALDRVVEQALAQLGIGADGAPVAVRRPLETVVGHETTLVQIVVNLISNALKFTRPGAAPVVTVSSERIGDKVRLVVADQGIGIRRSDQERIFRVFERADTRQPGTGIGLATVRRGAERIGGRVGVDSEPGRGSRFWVELPGARAEDA